MVGIIFSSGRTVCSCTGTARLRLTCTVAIRGDRNSRFSTIIVPILTAPPGLTCEGLFCATLAETGGLLILINGRNTIHTVIRGSGGDEHCDTLLRFLAISGSKHLRWRLVIHIFSLVRGFTQFLVVFKLPSCVGLFLEGSGVFNCSLNVSFNADSLIVSIPNGNIIMGRPSCITCSARARGVLCTNEETCCLRKHRPDKVSIVRPVTNNTVAGCSVTIRVIHFFVGGVVGGDVFGPEIITTISTLTASIREHAVVSIVVSTNTESIYLIRRPLYTTFNTKISPLRPAKTFIVSVKNNAASVTIVDRNDVDRISAIHITNGHFSSRVTGCVHRGCNVLVNGEVSRRVGGHVNNTMRHRRSIDVRTGKHSVFSKVPYIIRVANGRVCRYLGPLFRRLASTTHIVFRHAAPRVITSMAGDKVVVANNYSRVCNVSGLFSGILKLSISVTPHTRLYISGNTVVTLGGVRVLSRCNCHFRAGRSMEVE